MKRQAMVRPWVLIALFVVPASIAGVLATLSVTDTLFASHAMIEACAGQHTFRILEDDEECTPSEDPVTWESQGHQGPPGVPCAGCVDTASLAEGAVDSAAILDESIVAIDVDKSVIQLRVVGACPAGEFMTAVDEDGEVTCVADIDSEEFWKLDGNSGTSPIMNFLGTIDDQPLDIRVHDQRALRIEPNAASPKLIGGFNGNSVSGTSEGITIGGGGASGQAHFGSGDYGTIGGGLGNVVRGEYSTISGGESNIANPLGSTVGGGKSNTASGVHSTVGGGQNNETNGSSEGGTISGGINNFTQHNYTTIGGGLDNNAGGGSSVVGGGRENSASGTNGTVSGGRGNSSVSNATVGGGTDNIAGGVSSTIGGGGSNDAIGNWSTIGGGANNTASDFFPTVGGGESNIAGNRLATVGGGTGNEAMGVESTVSGGTGNHATGTQSTVSGGQRNTATAYRSTVGGGFFNNATAENATIAGGRNNTAKGEFSTVPGGFANLAAGDYSFASGRSSEVSASHDGTFLFSDSNTSAFTSAAANEFAVRATGGVRFHSGLAPSGVTLAPGAGSWSSLSDGNAKFNFAAVNQRHILERLAQVDIGTWGYKTQDESIRHIGPTAQDFYSAFNVGEDPKRISTVDADGVALAAIQGLYQIVQEKDAQIAGLESRLAALEQASGVDNSQAGYISFNSPLTWLLAAGVLAGGLVWVRRRGAELKQE